MSVSIESILRAVAGVADDGAGGFEWWGNGVSQVQRTAIGVFVFTFDESVDISQSVLSCTPVGPGGQAGSYYASHSLTPDNCTVSVWDANVAAVDPDGLYMFLNSSSVETDWVSF